MNEEFLKENEYKNQFIHVLFIENAIEIKYS